MKTRLIAATLLLAALPLAAQADRATDRALQLNQSPLSTPSQGSVSESSAEAASRPQGGSAAMAEARLRLRTHQAETDFAVNEDATRLAREATG